ncbi:MAG: TRAP transporter large permease [Candidatus Competibacteraceae bacterium]|nr:TRAP transporter large permease [Candidatus Competibacteraceae bacterium]
MAGLTLLATFLILLVLGIPLAVALGLAGGLLIGLEGLGLLAIPTNFYAGIAKYPLLAIPMFILAGLIFERSGVALRLVRFIGALIGQWRGSLAVVAVLVCTLMGGISGSGPADAAAVAAVMIPTLWKQGYPKPFSAALIAAAGSMAIVIPPSVAFIIYGILVPSASVPALFAAGLLPGLLAALALTLTAVGLSRRHGFGAPDIASKDSAPRLSLWTHFREAIWGLLAPVVILGGMRAGLFTPSEAAVVAVAYGLVVGLAIYRTLSWREVWRLLAEAGEISGVVLLIIGLASVFAWAGSTVGVFDGMARGLAGLHTEGWVTLLWVNGLLLVAGMFLDAISVYLILLPLLEPLAQQLGWHPVWFGVVMTLNLAIGQATPPMAVSLMVTARIAGVSMESTLRWALWPIVALLATLLLVIFVPELALWLPRQLGYL